MTTPVPVPLIQRVPCIAIFRVSRKFSSVMLTRPLTGSLCGKGPVNTRTSERNQILTSPVRTLRSNCKSELTSMSLISAGIFSPMLMVTKSPGTKSLAGTFDCSASRRTRTSEGSIPLMDAITREVEKSCQALKMAWRKRTIKRTTASARLEGFGLGSPRGFLLPVGVKN